MAMHTCIEPEAIAALTVCPIIICGADLTTELNWDVQYADTFIGPANPMLIGALDTTNRAASMTSFTSDQVALARPFTPSSVRDSMRT